ncbi:MAG: PQQ-binding-like beta-propeller repeat protein [Phycisphaerae bacterium]|nr:PQQ-binding-like beta-propeller repeat protein [Phycisphaerae bacterium]
MNRDIVYAFFFIIFSFCGRVSAEDWPTFGADNRRSCVTSEQLELPLTESWVFKATHPPQPAWPAPAKQDFFHRHYNLRPTVTYDQAFGVVGAGDIVCFGSSADDKIYALDSITGQIRWTFFTEGPVRLAPIVVGDRVYVGSDDGCVYCLSGDDGSLVWKYRVSEQNRIVPGNGRMISMWPVRAGLVADEGKVYFTAGLFPTQGTYLCAINAQNGAELWKQKVDISPQGYMLASDDKLYVPTGRTGPVMFARADGKFQGQFPSAGGTYALLTEDVMVTGPGRGPKELSADDVKTKDRIATFGGLRILVNGPIAYMQSEKNLSAFNRSRHLELSRRRNSLKQQQDKIEKQLKGIDKDTPQSKQFQDDLRNIKTELGEISQQLKNCYLWTVECEYPHSMIMAGNVLFVGGEDKVAAFSTKDGKEIWTTPVIGTAHGLSVINGGLYVSTDKGYIHCLRDGEKRKSKVITAEIDSNPYPQDELTELYTEAAKDIVKQTDIRKGYCLVLDCGEGRLAYELARLTDLQIIGVEKDANKVAIARKALDKAGLYGQVVIHQGSVEKLPYTKYFANLIVSDEALGVGKPPSWHQEVFELARPYGGVIALGLPANRPNKNSLKKWFRKSTADWKVNESKKIIWAFANREKLEGAGEWTHLYAEPGNTACSRDELIKGEMAIQWFGRPGPSEMIDRHHRNVPPLFKDGRLFVPGDCIVFAVDAYNGTILWETEIPNSRRLGVFLDSGSMAVDKKFLYVAAEDKCLGFDVQTGLCRLTYTMPQLIKDEQREWGYIAYSNDILFGSGRRKGASYTETNYDADVALWHRNMKLVVSDYVFAMNKNNGRPLWKYKYGLVVNTTITVADGRMYFVETHSPKALADKVGRMPVKILFDDGEKFLVALDIQTGRVVYKKKIDVSNIEEPVYLNYSKEILLLSGSKLVGDSICYYYNAFDARSGQTCWDVSHDSGLAKDGGHGEYNRHPTIIDNVVYAWPYAYNLKTGEKVAGWIFDRRGHGCGGVSASAQCMFWRGGNPWMYDLGPNGGPTRLNSVTRPGCWINIIPAGGLVLIPEASSGCTCGFALQTSVAYIPVDTLNSK